MPAATKATPPGATSKTVAPVDGTDARAPLPPVAVAVVHDNWSSVDAHGARGTGGAYRPLAPVGPVAPALSWFDLMSPEG